MLSLNYFNACSGISSSSASFCFSIAQNFLGYFFIISGSLCCSRALLVLHVFLNIEYAALVDSCFFPCVFLVCLYVRFASLHALSYHGARCLFHLFGLLWLRFDVLLTTPATFASSIRNASIFWVRSSLLWAYVLMIWLNAVANWVVDECDFHLLALVMYSETHDPSIH